MWQIRISKAGRPRFLLSKEPQILSRPQASGEPRIRVEASGGNFADLMGRSRTIVRAIFLMF
jgi:hypothetical protein